MRFGIFKGGQFHEQFFPYDPIPRVIGADEFSRLERGLAQRVRALNAFLRDIYSEKQIIRDKVVPEDFVFSSSGYLPQINEVMPPAGVYAHITGEDLVQDADGSWVVLEDNPRIPSGASYPLIARNITRRIAPDVYAANNVRDNRDYPALLSAAMAYSSCGGIPVILTPGRYNAAIFEHAYLAELRGARERARPRQGRAEALHRSGGRALQESPERGRRRQALPAHGRPARLRAHRRDHARVSERPHPLLHPRRLDGGQLVAGRRLQGHVGARALARDSPPGARPTSARQRTAEVAPAQAPHGARQPRHERRGDPHDEPQAEPMAVSSDPPITRAKADQLYWLGRYTERVFV